MTGHAWERPLTRRGALRTAALGAAAFGLAGCGLDRSDPDAKAKSERAVKAKVDGDLYYFNWAEYLDPALIKGFEKRYGVRVIESNFDSMQGMLAKLGAGNRYDLIFPSAEWVDRLRKGDRLLRIDHAQLRNYGQVTGSPTTSTTPGTTRSRPTRCPTPSTRPASAGARTRSATS